MTENLCFLKVSLSSYSYLLFYANFSFNSVNQRMHILFLKLVLCYKKEHINFFTVIK
ncbi:Uncharacterised protein [Legionella bozemanae]|uniref:Uncharacterized protein n=1 Tax=Legionella bozemanae TaxID=447 RepID=A0A0W0RYQ0_LEGBO|nr:hypothetical protein Lboz_0626 [Legionella bozemanae]STO32516.1 Uncharacterised protein [Legionella bozemanae]